MHKLVGINSLRFFAIVFIVIYHLFRSFLPGGFIAVDIFFCISGFLISTKIIGEADAIGKVKYKNFIKSRLKRLYPSLLICVLACLTIGAFVNPDVITGARRNTLTALTFTSNFSELFAGGSYENSMLPNLFENTWFLSLIFQFYLLLPLLLNLFLKIFRKHRDAIKFYGIALLIIGICSAFLMACYGGFFEMPDRAYFAPDSHAAAFCFGAAFAVFNYFRPRAPRTKKRAATLWLTISLIAIAVMSFTLHYDSPATFIFGLTATSVLSVTMLECIIYLQQNIRSRRKIAPVIRVLEYLGGISFGVYLFHWPLYILLPHILPPDTADWGYAIIDIILSLILAEVTRRIVSIQHPRLKIVRMRPLERGCVGLVGAFIIVATVISLIRAPQTSSIAEQLSSVTSQNSAGLIAATAAKADYISADDILDQTVTILDAQLKLAQDAEMAVTPNVSLAAPNANAARMLVIGDSVTLGAKDAIEATIAKSFVDAKENRGIEAATGILAGYAATGRLPDIIVISLATNERTITESLLQDIVNVAGNGHQFILVTAYAGPLQPRDSQNATLKAFASSRDNVYIADWWEIAHNNWSLMYADHIHLNPAGRSTYANLLNNVQKGIR